jgi:hypothetical protein
MEAEEDTLAPKRRRTTIGPKLVRAARRDNLKRMGELQTVDRAIVIRSIATYLPDQTIKTYGILT